MPRDPLPVLDDIFGAIAGIHEALEHIDYTIYRSKRPLRLAMEREAEIISEASRRLPEALKASEPGVSPREIAGIGNVLRLDYQIVADPVMWNLVEGHSPALEAAGPSAQRAAPPRSRHGLIADSPSA